MTTVTGAYDPWLVALSVAIAIVASFTALNLAGRVVAADGHARLAWLTGGAVAMGIGIWSMHFVGMLAFNLPTPGVPTPGRWSWPRSWRRSWHSGLALFVVSRRAMRLRAWLAGGTLMGLAIVSMHYIGMAAMRMPGNGSATSRCS